MANYTATGTIAEIYDTAQVSEKFKKREFILEVQDGQYPESIKFQLVQDKCSLIDTFAVGSPATVSFNLRGKGFNKNGQMLYFTNLEAWRIEAANAADNAPAAAPASTSRAGVRQNNNPALRAQPAPVAADDNDLPF